MKLIVHAFTLVTNVFNYSFKEMTQGILEATFTHSKNLACFVFAYKTLTSLMAWLETHEKQYQSFIAAFIGGYIVFGRYNKVNEQVGTTLVLFYTKFISLIFHMGTIEFTSEIHIWYLG